MKNKGSQLKNDVRPWATAEPGQIGVRIPEHMTETMSKLRQIHNLLMNRLGREPTINEVLQEADAQSLRS